MRLALVQYAPVWEDKSANKAKILKLLEKTEKIDLVTLPELSLTGFTMKSAEFSEAMTGETVNYFTEIALNKKCNVVGGFIEQEGKNKFNTSVFIDSNGKVLGSYRKIHPFSYSTEDKYYSAGKNYKIISTKSFKVGLSICYDLRFPELYRHYGKERTELIVNIANWPDTRIDHWRTLLKARAIENQCYVAGVNRVGDESKLHYNGYSSVFDPMGKELISVVDDEQVLICDIDLNYVKEIRNKFPFLEDIKLI